MRSVTELSQFLRIFLPTFYAFVFLWISQMHLKQLLNYQDYTIANLKHILDKCRVFYYFYIEQNRTEFIQT